MNIHYKIAIVLICLGTALQACNNKPAAEQQKTEEHEHDENIVELDSVQMRNAGIVTAIPQSRSMHSTIKVNGVVDVPPQSLISVSIPLGGYLKNTPLLPGYHITRGQVIATLEDIGYIQLQQDYLTAKAKMEYLETDMQRQKELSEAEAASKKNYQMVLSDYKMQQVLLKSLEEKLRLININPAKVTVNNISRTIQIYSPIDGYVSKVNVNIGKYVTPSDVLFELVNPDHIHAEITVFEKDFNEFKEGMKGKVYLVDKPSETYDVEVNLATKNIDENRSGLIHCHFKNPQHNLLPGMFLSGSFELAGQSVTAVPEEAVVRYMGKDYVFIANGNNKYTMTLVTTGTVEDGFVELKSLENINWQSTDLVMKGAYALLGKLKNSGESEHGH